MHGTADEIQSDPELLAKVVKAELGFVARAAAIYLLDGWERSVGAKRELQVALDCGLDVIVESATDEKGRAGCRCGTKQAATFSGTAQ